MSRKLSHTNLTNIKTFYFGAPYYPEHWDVETRRQDPERMAAAHFNVIRMAEFAWDIMEPEEGCFDFSLFDETIVAMAEKGIATILCTPTATPPRWLTYAHPDILRVNADGVLMQHGSRQHSCHSSPVLREYSRKITCAMAGHYAENPHVIGWQTDNEFNCHFSECHCESCQISFREFLRDKFINNSIADINALNTAWGTAFWAQTYRNFDEIQTPKNGKPAVGNPPHLLDYYRFISWNVTRFQHEQIEILRTANPKWFVTHNGLFGHLDYRGDFTQDLDFLSYDIYPFFDGNPKQRVASQAFNLDHARAWSGNFMIPEQQSGPGGQAAYFHDNPEPNEMRRMAYTSIAHGADSIMFFRWRTCRFGPEAYWCGILNHDNVPRRRYEELQKLGCELKTLGPQILGTHVRVDVGIAAADMDVYDAHETMSLGLPSPKAIAEHIHIYYLKQGYAVGCVHPSDDLSDLKLYIIPHWAMFKEEWGANLESYVKNGGVLVIGARTATKDWNNNVIANTPPGILHKLTGVKVMEYGRQNAPDKRILDIHFSKHKISTEHWYEHLEIYPQTVAIGHWDGRHLNGKPAITMKNNEKGMVIYIGTYIIEELLSILTPKVVEFNEMQPLWPEAPEGVQVVVRENSKVRFWFFINSTDQRLTIKKIPADINAVSGNPLSHLSLEPNDVAVVKEAL